MCIFLNIIIMLLIVGAICSIVALFVYKSKEEEQINQEVERLQEKERLEKERLEKRALQRMVEKERLTKEVNSLNKNREYVTVINCWYDDIHKCYTALVYDEDGNTFTVDHVTEICLRNTIIRSFCYVNSYNKIIKSWFPSEKTEITNTSTRIITYDDAKKGEYKKYNSKDPSRQYILDIASFYKLNKPEIERGSNGYLTWKKFPSDKVNEIKHTLGINVSLTKEGRLIIPFCDNLQKTKD